MVASHKDHQYTMLMRAPYRQLKSQNINITLLYTPKVYQYVGAAFHSASYLFGLAMIWKIVRCLPGTVIASLGLGWEKSDLTGFKLV